MFVIPAIDIIDGKCVRLTMGNYSKVKIYDQDPLAVAKKFQKVGAHFLHVVDLDGARAGKPVNGKIISRIAKNVSLKLQVGGGIRTFEQAKNLLNNSVERIILGTAVVNDFALLKKLVNSFGPDRLVVSLDLNKGKIAINGWEKTSPQSVESVLNGLLDLGIFRIVVTDISKDGMMAGPNFEMIKNFVKKGFEVIASGGVSTIEDLQELNKIGAFGAIVGKALYEKKLDLKEAVKSVETKNKLAKRIIPCLDIKDGRVVKGTNFVNLKDAGDALQLAKLYSKLGADELVFLDISATLEKRKTLKSLVENIAKEINIPFTVGGGISTLDDIKILLNAGADKVSIGSAAVKNPKLVKDAAKYFGAQCIVISVDVKKVGDTWKVFIRGGSEETDFDVIKFVKHMEALGAGELLVNSLDRDGTKKGFDLVLLKNIVKAVGIPVIASSGAGKLEHFLEVFRDSNVDAALGASIFHYGEISIKEVKRFLKDNSINIRL